MAHRGAIAIAALSAAASIGWTGAAFAQADAYAPGQGSPNKVDLHVNVKAQVGGVCGFDTVPDADYTIPDVDLGFTQDTAFVLNCNGASRVAIESANGGLVASGSVASGYTNNLDYKVTLHLEGDSALTADADCDASTLTSGGSCSFIGPAGYSQGLELAGPSTSVSGSYVNISAPAYSGASNLVASSAYQDTLTVTLSASL